MGFHADFGMAKLTSKVIHLGHFLLFVCFMTVTAARVQFEGANSDSNAKFSCQNSPLCTYQVNK